MRRVAVSALFAISIAHSGQLAAQVAEDDPAQGAPARAPATAAPEPDSSGEAASREPPERSLLRAAPSAPYAPRFQRGLSLGGFLHAQYVESQLSEDQLSQSGAPLNEDQFSLRRGRLAISYGAAYAAATLELDASTHRGERIGVRRAEATLLYRSEREELVPAFVTLGVTDVPFGYELAESPTSRLFAEHSTASLALFPVEMDVGLKIGGSYAFLRYAVALMNGEVSPSGLGQDTNGHKDLVGRLGVDTSHDSETLAVQGGVSFAVGQGLHPGSPARKGGVVWIDENQDGVAQSGEIVGVQGTSARRAQNFDRWALGLDLGLSLSSALGTGRFAVEVYLASNHDRGLFIADPVLQSIDVGGAPRRPRWGRVPGGRSAGRLTNLRARPPSTPTQRWISSRSSGTPASVRSRDCSSHSRRTPTRPRSIMASMSARGTASPSAVPWISTTLPWAVATKFKSTRAVLSSA